MNELCETNEIKGSLKEHYQLKESRLKSSASPHTPQTKYFVRKLAQATRSQINSPFLEGNRNLIVIRKERINFFSCSNKGGV